MGLLRCGAAIDEVNVVRKHISDIKGGRLAAICYPATVVTLIISDVVGDSLDVIASGPTAPDQSTFEDAVRILRKYALAEEFPRINEHLRRGMQGVIPETLKAGDAVLNRIHNFLISGNEMVLRSVLKDISKHHTAKLLTTKLVGEARDVGQALARKAMNEATSKDPLLRPKALLAGGETTVTVRGNGKGGRNQELVLAAMSELKGEGVVIASIGSDGIDGVTDAAGAMADSGSYKRAVGLGLSLQKYLDDNDSYSFFKKLGETIITGPTGTNINDVSVIVFA
jgi:glycerate-2-kinase